ncbi:unnamed protein product [Tilletia caries]|nr:unnamed protein product [Tilletia caries]
MAKLTSSNWSHWHPLLLLILRGRDLLDTIDPAAVPNDDEDAGPVNPLAVEMFRRRQDRTAYIIGFSCSPSIQAKVIKKHSPIDMLEVAKEECLSGSYANTARFLKQLIDLGSEPKEDMREHIGKIDTIFSNLNAVGYPLTEKAKVVHLLATLPSSYGGLAMAMDVLGSAATYERLQVHITEEEHRQHHYTAQAKKETALIAHQASASKSNNDRQRSPRSDRNARCDYCKKKGHDEDVCRTKERHEEEDKGVSDRADYAYTGRETHSETIYMGQVMLCTDKEGTRSLLTFIVDSGATEHIVTDLRWFTEFEPVEESRVVTTANGDRMPVLGIGAVKVCTENGEIISIYGAAYVPGAVSNLLSVSKMVDEGLKVIFAKDTCRVTRPDRTCVATATREEAAAQDTAERHRARPLLDLQEDMFDQKDMHPRDVAYARAILTKQQDPSSALLDFGLADSTGAAEQREYL